MSNLLEEILQYHLSNNLFLDCISSFHLRISEAAFGCYEEFKSDRKLETWTTKFISYDNINGMNSGSDNINLTTLDQIISQLVTMRLVVSQYQLYLIENCYISDNNNEEDQDQGQGKGQDQEQDKDICEIDDKNNQQNESDEINSNNNENLNFDEDPGIDSFIQLATDTNISKWKEVEGMYMVLERLYLQHAVRQALLPSYNWKKIYNTSNEQGNIPGVLIEVQPHVYALQVISS